MKTILIMLMKKLPAGMMMMIKNLFISRFFIIVVILLIFNTKIFTQTKDFQIWSTAGIEKKINKNISVSLEEEARFYNNASFLKKYFTDIGIDYEFLRFFDASVNYRFITNRDYDSNFKNQKRYYFDLSIKQSYSSFRFSFRTRYQIQQENSIQKEMGELDEKYSRNKISIEYNIPNFPVSPNFASELFYKIDKTYNSFFDKIRYTFGAEYSINNDNQLEIYYMIQNEINQSFPEYSYIFGVSYKYDF